MYALDYKKKKFQLRKLNVNVNGQYLTKCVLSPCLRLQKKVHKTTFRLVIDRTNSHEGSMYNIEI